MSALFLNLCQADDDYYKDDGWLIIIISAV